MSQKWIHISKLVQVIPVWVILPELVLAKPYMLSNKMLPKKSKKYDPPKKQLRLDVELLSDIVIKNKTKTVNELVLFSKNSSMEGKRDILRWLLTHTNGKQWQDSLQNKTRQVFFCLIYKVYTCKLWKNWTLFLVLSGKFTPAVFISEV